MNLLNPNRTRPKDGDPYIYIGVNPKVNNTYGEMENLLGSPFMHLDKDLGYSLYQSYFEHKLQDPRFGAILAQLSKHTLGCTCLPYKCHGQIIMDYVNGLGTPKEPLASTSAG